jgi:hypothetical protein
MPTGNNFETIEACQEKCLKSKKRRRNHGRSRLKSNPIQIKSSELEELIETAPVIDGVRLPDDQTDTINHRNGKFVNNVFVPDSLDALITKRNHDLEKRKIANRAKNKKFNSNPLKISPSDLEKLIAIAPLIEGTRLLNDETDHRNGKFMSNAFVSNLKKKVGVINNNKPRAYSPWVKPFG